MARITNIRERVHQPFRDSLLGRVPAARFHPEGLLDVLFHQLVIERRRGWRTHRLLLQRVTGLYWELRGLHVRIERWRRSPDGTKNWMRWAPEVRCQRTTTHAQRIAGGGARGGRSLRLTRMAGGPWRVTLYRADVCQSHLQQPHRYEDAVDQLESPQPIVTRNAAGDSTAESGALYTRNRAGETELVYVDRHGKRVRVAGGAPPQAIWDIMIGQAVADTLVDAAKAAVVALDESPVWQVTHDLDPRHGPRVFSTVGRAVAMSFDDYARCGEDTWSFGCLELHLLPGLFARDVQ